MPEFHDERFGESRLLAGRRLETARREISMRGRILEALGDGPRTVPELAGVLGLPSREVMWWLMGCVRYNLVEAVGEPGPDGYQKYGIVSEGD